MLIGLLLILGGIWWLHYLNCKNNEVQEAPKPKVVETVKEAAEVVVETNKEAIANTAETVTTAVKEGIAQGKEQAEAIAEPAPAPEGPAPEAAAQ